jgi:hypothetical protein
MDSLWLSFYDVVGIENVPATEMHMKLLNAAPRYVLSFFCALLPLHAMAIDLTPDASRVLSDPSYLPLKGQLYGSTQYSYGSGHSETDNYLGVEQGSNKTVTNTVTQVLQYGLTDDFTLRVHDNYQWGHSDRNGTTSSTDTNFNGFNDPAFEATWRVLDQRSFPISWDIFGGYAPDWINAKQASPTEDGTVARGGDMTTIGTALSYKMRDFTIYGSGRATYLGSRDIYNQTNGNTSDYDANWQYGLALATQTRLTNLWSVNVGVAETFNQNASVTRTSGADYTNDPGNSTALTTALNYQVVPNRVVASLTYGHDFFTDGHNDYAVATSDTTQRNHYSDTVGVNLQYVF